MKGGIHLQRTFAKVSAPGVAPTVLPRLRLFGQLEALRRHRVIWVVAPPGAGKTSLLASWLQHAGHRHLWLQLDAGDGDVATFFHYLALAAEAFGRKRRLPTFTPDFLNDPGAFARIFFRELCAEAARRPFVLALEDYHEIRSDSPLHAALAAGLRELPKTVAVVVTSRAEPPRCLARLRANGELEVLRGDELSMSLGEARAVARRWGYSPRDERLVREVHARTEGWAAGLVLLLAGRQAGAGRSGEREGALFDYFAEEVLDRADPDTRQVLLETAFLRRVEGAVAARLTGVARAGVILAELSRRGYFIVRIEAERETYQLHGLFREFLLRRAEAEVPEGRRCELRLGAARALEEAGEVEEAFELYGREGAWNDAARLVAAQAPALLGQGRAEIVEGWLAWIPEELRNQDPWLLYWRGRARVPVDPGGARAHLLRAFEAFRSDGKERGAFLAWSAVAESYLWEAEDLSPLDHWIAVLEDLDRRFPDFSDPEVEPQLVGAAFAAFHNRQPSHPALLHWERRALSLALSPGDQQLRLDAALSLLQGYAVMLTDFNRARLIEAFRPLGRIAQAVPAKAIRWHTSLGVLQVYRGSLDAALEAADRGLRLSRENGIRAWNVFLHGIRCFAHLGRGDLASSERDLREVTAAAELGPKLGRSVHHFIACILARHRGDLQRAAEHGRNAMDLAATAGLPVPEADCMLASALAEPASSILPALQRAAERARRIGSRLVHAASLLGLALAHLRRGEEPAALEPLREGLTIARERGILHFVYFTSEELADCCAVALAHGIEPDHVTELIRTRRLAPGERGRGLDVWPWEIRIEALGGFEIFREGERLRSARKAQKKPLELLKRLVASGEKGMRQDLLAEALWPDADGDAAHHALATTLYRTRKLMGRSDALLQRAGRVALDPRVVFVDAWALQRALDGAEAAKGGASSREQAATRVRALYRGDLFGADVEDPGLLDCRERLRARTERWMGR